MKLFNGVLLALLVALLVFAALNWTALAAPTLVSFAFFRAEAPLGVIVLGFAIALAFLAFAHAAVQRTAMLVESRRHAQELKALRELAEQAEASRLAELRRQLEESTNTLAAHIGQIDDKLNRLGRGTERSLPPP
jgi:uncharacterized integral membrane protein